MSYKPRYHGDDYMDLNNLPIAKEKEGEKSSPSPTIHTDPEGGVMVFSNLREEQEREHKAFWEYVKNHKANLKYAYLPISQRKYVIIRYEGTSLHGGTGKMDWTGATTKFKILTKNLSFGDCSKFLRELQENKIREDQLPLREVDED